MTERSLTLLYAYKQSTGDFAEATQLLQYKMPEFNLKFILADTITTAHNLYISQNEKIDGIILDLGLINDLEPDLIELLIFGKYVSRSNAGILLTELIFDFNCAERCDLDAKIPQAVYYLSVFEPEFKFSAQLDVWHEPGKYFWIEDYTYFNRLIECIRQSFSPALV